MKIQPINAIESALLHTRFSEMRADRLTDAVGAAMRKVGLTGAADVASVSDDKLVLNAGDFCVTVLQKNQPLDRAGFGGCLPQPITLIMMPDAEQRVDAHIAHSFVSITRAARVAVLDEDDSTYGLGDFRTSHDAHLAMKLGYWITDALHRNNPATAIHWLPSDHLVSPRHFEQAAFAPSLTGFFIRPYLYSSAGSIAEGNPVGLVANGSQYLMDRPIIFEEERVDYRWMIERSGQFIDQVIKDQKIPDEGAAFVPDEDEIIEVLYRDAEASNPMGSYTLVARNVPKFGIRGGLNSVLHKRDDEPVLPSAERKLDENDPIDLAILNALKERAEEMRQPTKVPEVKDRRMGPRETHEIASFGRRAVFGKR